MSNSRPKPQSLRPLSVSHRRWFWALLLVGIGVIVIGWTMTIREIARDIPLIQTGVEQGVDQAARRLQDADVDSFERFDDAQEALDAFIESYQAEKQQSSIQSESYGQEDSSNGTTP